MYDENEKQYNEATQGVFNQWVDHLQLMPIHTSGAFESINKKNIDLYVCLHGEERALKALLSCKTRSALQALSVIDSEEMQEANKRATQKAAVVSIDDINKATKELERTRSNG